MKLCSLRAHHNPKSATPLLAVLVKLCRPNPLGKEHWDMLLKLAFNHCAVKPAKCHIELSDQQEQSKEVELLVYWRGHRTTGAPFASLEKLLNGLVKNGLEGRWQQLDRKPLSEALKRMVLATSAA
jgi:hypothetical protein